MHSECNVMQERKTAQGIFSASNQFISKYVHIAQLSPAFLQDQPTKVPGAVTAPSAAAVCLGVGSGWDGVGRGGSGWRGLWWGCIVRLLAHLQTWHLLESHWVSTTHMKALPGTSAFSSHLHKR